MAGFGLHFCRALAQVPRMKVDSKMRVLWVHNYEGELGGTFMRDILEAPGWNSSFEIRQCAIPVAPSLASLPDIVRKVRAAARDCDLVHAQFGSLCGFAASFAGKPLIISIRGSDFYLVPSSGMREWLKSRLRRAMSYVAMFRSRAVVAMSWRNRSEILNWSFLRGKSVEVIVDPAGLEFWPQASGNMPPAKLKVFVGSLRAGSPIKRVELVENAVALCLRAGLDISLVAVSGQPRSVVRKEMAACDLVALTSVYEGWPNVIKEGLLLGLPFVATDVSDLRDAARSDPRCRIVNDTPVAIACAFVDALFAKRLAAAGRDAKLASFWPEAASCKLRILYLSVMEGR